jgi:hypothetical protein
MEHIKPYYHRRLITHEWKLIHIPGFASYLTIDLHKDLGYNGSQILSFRNSSRENYLRWNWKFSD